jgi:hypothetical protein
MLKKLIKRVSLGLFLVLSLSGCSAVRGIGDALLNSFKGFTIHFP